MWKRSTKKEIERSPDPNREAIDDETIELACREAEQTLRTLGEWYAGLDGKIVTLFSVSSIIATVVPTLSNAQPESTVELIIWLGAGIAWLVAASACFVGFKLRRYRLDPSPRILFSNKWLDRSLRDYRYFRLRDLATSYDNVVQQYAKKAKAVKVAILFTMLEVLLLTLALILGPVL